MKKSRRNQILDIYRNDIGKLNGKTDKRYYIRIKDKSRKEGRYTIKAPTEEELLDKIYKWHIEHVEAEKIQVTTLESLHDEFLEYKKSTTWGISTTKRCASIWRVHYKDTEITKKPIKDITLKDLQVWAYGLIKKHDLTKKEFGNVCIWMKQMFEYALQEGIIEKNPYQFLKITNQNVFRHNEERSTENLVLSTDDELSLYKKCWEYFCSRHFPVHQLIPLAIISLFQLGLRPCEVCCLKYSDIKGDEILIQRYFSEKGKCIIDGRTKAGHSMKRVPLTTLMKELIQIARERQSEEGMSDPEYIFMMNDNFFGFYVGLRKAFPEICVSAGIPRNTPYSGRRTFISALIDANINIKTIQNYVGHNDSRTTFKNYCFDRSSKEARIKQLDTARLSLTTQDIADPVPICTQF